eukprot:symbB.v1.2.014795.t1/scaffold1089.1/size139057/7
MSRLQADHEEAHRCKDLAAELRLSKQECQAKLEGFRGYQHTSKRRQNGRLQRPAAARQRRSLPWKRKRWPSCQRKLISSRRSIWKHLRRKYCHFEKVAPNSLNVKCSWSYRSS